MRLDEAVAVAIADRYGLLLKPSMLGPLIAQLQLPQSLGDDTLLRELLSEPNRLRRLAGQLTIGESYFFRHPEQLRAISTWVVQRQDKGMGLTIWSAGCSRGEELYSVAMRLLLDCGPSARQKVVLRGSDLDTVAIDVARQGLYGQWSLRGTTEAEQARFFEPCGGGMRLVEELRSWPQFDSLSIQERLEQWHEGKLDVLLFRNVGIYLTHAALTEIHRGFARILADDGLLVQSATDPRPPVSLFSGAPELPVGLYVPTRASQQSSRIQVPAKVDHRTVPSRVAPRRPPGSETSPRREATIEALSLRTTQSNGEVVGASLEGISMLADRGQLDEAERRLAAYVVMHPRCTDGLLLRGQLALHRGEPSLAVQALRSLLFLEPEHHLGRYWYVVALERAGQSRAAAEHLRVLQRAWTSSDDSATPMSAELKEAIRELAKGQT